MAIEISSGVISSGIELNVYNNSMIVGQDGLASATIVNNGGNMTVEAGGQARDTTVNAGGSLTVAGYAQATVLSGENTSAAAMIVSGAGAVATDTTVNAYGQLKVSSGAAANNVTVDNNGSVGIFSSGLVNSITLQNNAQGVISHGGAASNVRLDNSVLQISGGAVYDAELNSNGKLEVYANGLVSNINLANDSASLTLSGKGAYAAAVALNGSAAQVNINSGGYLNGATLNQYYASANVNSAGKLENVTVFSGAVNIKSGGVASNAVISNGRIYISQTAAASNVAVGGYYGSVCIYAGGSADTVTVNSQGNVYISGGHANNTTISSGGRVYISQGNMSNTHVYSGGVLDITSSATHYGRLTIENGASVKNYFDGSSTLTIDFTVADLHGSEDYYLVNDLSRISVNKAYQITVDQYQASGEYKLAQGANALSGEISIYIGNSEAQSITINGDAITYDNRDYTLTLYEGSLHLTVGAYQQEAVTVFKSGEEQGADSVYSNTRLSDDEDYDQMVVLSGGSSYNTQLDNGGILEVYSGGYTNSTTINNGGTLAVKSAGRADNVTLNGGDLTADEGAVINQLLIQSGASAELAAGAAINDITVSGTLTVQNGFALGTATVADKGKLIATPGTGNSESVTFKHLTIAGSVMANSTKFSGSELTLDISNRSTADDFMVDNLKNFTVSANSIYITVNHEQASGDYKLAAQLSNIQISALAFTIGDIGRIYGMTSINGVQLTNGKTSYTLYTKNNDLYLKVYTDNTPPDAPKVILSTYDPTREDVTLTVTFADDAVIRQYSLDGGENWIDYREPFIVTESITVKFKSVDAVGNERIDSYEVDNIDQDAPVIPLVSIYDEDGTELQAGATTWKKLKLQLVPTEEGEIIRYKLSGEDEYQNYDYTAADNFIVLNDNTTVYFQVADALGNTAEYSQEINNIDRIAPDAPTVFSDITQATNKNVNLNATGNEDGLTIEYSTDNIQWKSYSGPVEVQANGTYYFRAIDAAGNISEVTTYEVTNIDKVAPEKPVITADITEATRFDVTLTAEFAEDSVRNEYSFDNKTWVTYDPTVGVVVENNQTVYFRSTDEAGNSSFQEHKIDYIDKTAPVQPQSSADITEITTSNVKVSATFAEDSIYNEYSLDGENWFEYVGSYEFTDNGIIYFRSTDAVGNVSQIESCEVTNIDRVAPTISNITITTPVPGVPEQLITADFADEHLTERLYSLDGGVTWNVYTDAGVKVANDGVIWFKAVDDADNTTINDSTVIDIPSVFVYSSGTVTSASKIINGAELVYGGDDRLDVYNGGSAGNTVLNNYGTLQVHSGGYASGALIDGEAASGSIAKNAYAEDITLLNGGMLYVEGSAGNIEISGNTDRFAGDLIVKSGGVASDVRVLDYGDMYVSSAGRADDVSVSDLGALYVVSGGKAGNIDLQGWLNISSGAVVSNVSATGSKANIAVLRGGVLDNAAIGSGARMYLSNTALVRNGLQIESGAQVIAYQGAVVDFTLTDRAAGTPAIVNDLSLIKGVPTYTITIDADQATGSYKLAEKADSFAQTISIGNGSENYGSLSVNSVQNINGVNYTLTNVSGYLNLTIARDTDELADLQISDFTLSTSSAVAQTEDIVLNFTVANNGSADAESSWAYIYDGDKLIGRTVVFKLNAGQSRLNTYTVANELLATGAHNLRIELDVRGQIAESDELNNSAEAAVEIRPRKADLTVTEFTTADGNTVVADDQKTLVKFTIQNSGYALALASIVKLKLGDKELGQMIVADLNVNESFSGSFRIDPLEAGDHNLQLIVDHTGRVEEDQEGNNTAELTLAVKHRQADLQVVEFAPENAITATGNDAVVNFTILNDGMTEAAESYVNIYNGDQLAAQILIGKLGAQESYTGSITLDKLPAGEYNLRIEADADNSVVEAVEDNNSAEAVLTIANRADLTISEFTAARTVFSDTENTQVNFTVQNDGIAGALASYARIYDGDTLLKEFVVTNLKAGESFSTSVNLGVLGIGEHNLHMVIDSSDRIAESAEDNNTADTVLTVKHLTDLAVTQFTAAGSVMSEQSNVVVSFTVANRSNANSPAAYAFIYDGEKLLGKTVIGQLLAGESYSGSYDLGKLALGEHNLRIEIDADNLVAESNKANNQSEFALSIQPLRPDLVITALEVPGEAIADSNDAVVQFTVTNQGTANALASYAKLIIDGKEYTFVIPQLSINESFNGSYNIGRRGVGEHTLQLEVNSGNRLTESDITNNSAETTFQVVTMPDLEVVEFTSGNLIADVHNADVKFTIKNSGTAEAAASKAYIYNGDKLLAEVDVDNLAVGGEYTATVDLGLLPAGEHNLRIEVNADNVITESNSGNNSADTVLTVVSMPDLYLTAFATTRPVESELNEAVVEFTVTNQGTGDSTSTKAFIYEGNNLLQEVVIDALAANASQTYSCNIGQFELGDHQLRIEVQACSPESNAENNTAETTFTVVGMQDLAVISLTAVGNQTTFIDTENTVIEFTVQNNGTATAAAAKAYLYDGNKLLAEADVAELAVGGEYTGSIDLGLLPAGEHNLRIVLDAGSGVLEAFDNNNTGSLELTVNSHSDLVATEFKLVDSIVSDAQFTAVNFVIKNNGTGGVLASYADIYDGETKLGRVVIPALQAGGEFTGSFNIAPLAAGEHKLQLVVDASDIIAELHEDNNSAEAILTVRNHQPDLQFANLTIADNTVSAGENVTLSFTIKNDSLSSTPATYADIYLDDVRLYRTVIGSLQADGEYSGNFTILAGRLTEGLHNIRIECDIDNRVTEAHEDNNSAQIMLYKSNANDNLAAWEILGSGDFDGDGLAELAMFNDGAAAIATLNNGTIVSCEEIGSIDSCCSFSEIADFNNDGIDDIAWSCNGEQTRWLIKDKKVDSIESIASLA